MSQGLNEHRYEIWWVDRANGPDVKIPGDHQFDDYHQAQQELLKNGLPASGHYVIMRFAGNGPAGEIVHVDHRR